MARRAIGRRSVFLAGAAAIMPLAASSLTPAPAAAQALEPFRPPDGPMLLIRTTRKPLPDGEEVLTRRSYEVRFVRDGEGYRIDGELLAAEVEAPPPLRRLAEIERRRPDEGMFPLRLDASGKLTAGGSARPSPVTQGAIDTVAGLVDKTRLAPAEKMQAKAFVLGLHARQGFSAWPEDLFRPVAGLRRETRTIPTDNGAPGRLLVEISANTAGPNGLLAALTRTVTSELDGDRRSNYEQWTLVPR
jgi:hypothetical protein